MKRLLLIILAFLTTELSYGWGKNGHMITARLAEQFLTPEARKAVKDILGDESLADASVWLDSEINNSDHKNQDHWHYAYKDAVLEENALIMLPTFVETLKSSEASEEDKRMALRSLVHIAGDIHVPLHCGYKSDAGGHKPKLSWQGQEGKTNLHRVWDSDMLLRYQSDVDTYVNELQGKITREKQEKWASTDFSIWVNESQELLEQAYDFEGRELTDDYYEQNIVLVNERLSMSAYRLAYLLNGIFS